MLKVLLYLQILQCLGAEAKFFRAYSHFELVQLYGDAIVLTQPLDLDSEILYGKRNDRSEVIDQVIKDLRRQPAVYPKRLPKPDD